MVSSTDYFLARQFDLDNNGVLDADEQDRGREIMAREFFEAKRRHVGLGDKILTDEDISHDVYMLVERNDFAKAITGLQTKERRRHLKGSQQVTSLLQRPWETERAPSSLAKGPPERLFQNCRSRSDLLSARRRSRTEHNMDSFQSYVSKNGYPTTCVPGWSPGRFAKINRVARMNAHGPMPLM